MAKTFHVEIVTPQQIVFQGEVVAVRLPGVVAPFQVLINHAPIVTELETGHITIDDGTTEHYFATSGGFVEMRNNRMTVILETVEAASEIDVARAQRAQERAEERVREGRRTHGEIDITRAEAALARASNRIRVAAMR